METEDKVCTLEQAKKLAVLGFKKESEKYWVEGKLDRVWLSTEFELRTHNRTYDTITPAYDVAELGDILPSKLDIGGEFGGTFAGYIEYKKLSTTYYVSITQSISFGEYETEAQARAEALIWLIENKYIEIGN